MFPRPLTDHERAVVEHMLQADSSDLQTLRGVTKSFIATGTCPCGCGTIDLELSEQPVEAPDRLVLQADHYDPALVVWLILEGGGREGLLEVMAYDGNHPAELPDPARLSPARTV